MHGHSEDLWRRSSGKMLSVVLFLSFPFAFPFLSPNSFRLHHHPSLFPLPPLFFSPPFPSPFFLLFNPVTGSKENGLTFEKFATSTK